MKTKKFNYKTEQFQNPYIGFTSFQHFRGEKLYSDCITGKDGIAGCETENYECYPVPEGIEENGREQGYYPDTTVAYIRILWKEFEPKQGEYNYKIIQDVLDKAKEKGQTVMFRLMPHSTCERDDVPDWLKTLIPCPARPEGMRVKASPTDPLYLELFSRAIVKIGERFDTNETLDCIDISLGGAWGEGAQEFSEEEEKNLMDIYINSFPNTKLIGQCGNPKMLNYVATKRTIGWRSDGTGNPRHTHIWFPGYYPNIKNEHWKTAPISFESYWWISEWYRQGWDIDEVINFTLSHHISTFNNKSFPIQYELKDKIDNWVAKMGYHYTIKEVEYDEKAINKLNINLEIENVGVAPIYNRIPFVIKLRNNSFEKEFITDIDIRKWMPGKISEQIDLDVQGLPQGKYELLIGIHNNNGVKICFATDAKQDNAYAIIDSITIN